MSSLRAKRSNPARKQNLVPQISFLKRCFRAGLLRFARNDDIVSSTVCSDTSAYAGTITATTHRIVTKTQTIPWHLTENLLFYVPFIELFDEIMRDPILNIAINAARSAGNIIIRASDRLDTVTVAQKRPNDYVTDIDTKAEQEIINIIRKAHPTHGILGEESGETLGKNDDYVWIIDPIDGTRNFIHGYPQFAVSIGISYKGKIEHGVIYDPVRQELFTASRGKGARLNDKRIRVSKRTELEDCLLATGFTQRGSKELLAEHLRALEVMIPLCGDIRRPGAATLDLAYVACGRLDGFWELGLKIWDIAAGTLLIKEAGGLVCDPDGGEDYLNSGNVVVANPKILKLLLKNIRPFLG